ncbi:hypothetical protein D3C72_110940 [compost metagenome]
MAIQNINSVTRVQSMAATAAPPSNPLGVEWVSGPAQNTGLQVDWATAAPPASPPPPSLVTSPAPYPGQKPIPFKVEPEHVRIGTPLITQVGNWIADKVGLGSVGGGGAPLDPSLPMDPGLGGALPGDPMVVDPGMSDPTLLDPTLSPDFSGGSMGGVGGGVSRAFDALKDAANAGFQAAKGALKRNFIFAGITSAISNGISYFTGKATGKQAVSGFVADTGAYTAIGSASTFAGAALGTLIPIPFVGTAIGIAAGMGLGYLYEKFVRKGLVKQVEGVVDGLSGAVGKKALS